MVGSPFFGSTLSGVDDVSLKSRFAVEGGALCAVAVKAGVAIVMVLDSSFFSLGGHRLGETELEYLN